MIRSISAIMLCLGLQGCAMFGWKSVEPLTIKKEEVARIPLNLPDPPPIRSHSPRWIVITPSNADKVWQELRDKKIDVVLFALTDEGYEELSINLAEIRNFIELQRRVTQEYRKYYEPPKLATDR